MNMPIGPKKPAGGGENTHRDLAATSTGAFLRAIINLSNNKNVDRLWAFPMFTIINWPYHEVREKFKKAVSSSSK